MRALMGVGDRPHPFRLRWMALRLLAAAGALVAVPPPPARAEPDLAPYLVQAACLDAAGQVRPGAVPTDPDCGRRRPLSVDEPLPYRKHDWPSVQTRAVQPRGWAAGDSLRGSLLGRPAILQGWDFGDDPQRAFGRFDAGKGDGGQAVLLLPDGSAAAALTEDGGAGVQWLPSPDCARQPGIPSAGWLFAAPPVTEAWHERVGRAARVPQPGVCPPHFTAFLTRWRLARLDLPVGDVGNPALRAVPVDLLLSEHFGGTTVAGSTGMERFFFVRDLGWVRWEHWEDLAASSRPELARQAATLAEQRRCPPLAFSDPPGPHWAMVGCRTWTNFLRAPDRAAMRPAPAWPTVAR